MIYLDNAATTKIFKEAFEKMLPFYTEHYGNASEMYDFATTSRKAMNDARRQIAKLIGADISEIFFTSGGTEADNWALTGTAEANAAKGRHIITTKIEHHAVLNTCKYLEKRGFEVTYLPVNEKGLVDIKELEKAIRKDTILISVMTANNEIGTIQPVEKIGAIAGEHGILFHTDAVQAFGNIPVNVKEAGIDLLSASAHKCHGPKGIGILYVKNGTKISNFHFGGKQERNMRAGTENVPAIVGFGEAARISGEHLDNNIENITKLRNHFISRVTAEIEDVIVNGDKDMRLPGNVNFCFKYIDGEAIQIQLDFNEIYCSTGSACNAGSKKISHVLSAICVPEEYAHGSIRFTISEENTIEEIDKAADKLCESVNKLRAMSNEYRNQSSHIIINSEK